MQIVPLDGGGAGFLAIQKFFPVFRSEEACIVHAVPGSSVREPWRVTEVYDLPFIHRMDVVRVGDTPHVVASTLCGGKEYQEDWSKPGAVYAGPVPPDVRGPWRLDPVLEGITKNHGMHVATLHGKSVVLVSGSEGVFQLSVPENPGDSWDYSRLIDRGVSDIYLFDVDGDGRDEIIPIEPFHGDNLVIYREARPGSWEPAYHRTVRFGHVVWAGLIRGQPAVVYGNRGGAGELGLLTNFGGMYENVQAEMLEEGAGPAAIEVVHTQDVDVILSAQHESDRVTLYEISSPA
jgi:hypothetical protein